jgi:ADP-ribosylglycohydrolase
VGMKVGVTVGELVGDSVGDLVGMVEGVKVGNTVGDSVGCCVGSINESPYLFQFELLLNEQLSSATLSGVEHLTPQLAE